MNKETSASLKILAGMQYGTTGLKEHLPLITHLHLHVILRRNPLLDLIGKMVDIHHHFFNAEAQQLS